MIWLDGYAGEDGKCSLQNCSYELSMCVYNPLVDFDKNDYSGMIITNSRDVLEPRLEIGLTMEQHAVPSERKIETGNRQPHLISLPCVML